MRKRKIKRLILIIAAIALVVPAAIFGVAAIQTGDFSAHSEKVFRVPDLDSGFVPQGLEFLPENKLYLISGYLGETAQLKLVGKDKSFSAALLDENGEELKSHAGGVCASGNFVYISGEKSCYAFKLSDILSGSAVLVGKFSTNNRASFCFSDEKHLYVGEYYYASLYPTDESHHIETPCGDKNNALVFAFPIDEKQPLGVKTEPVFAYSITGSVQGMEIVENTAFLSASERPLGSRLLSYDISAVKIGSFGEIPLVYLDSSNLIARQSMLPQSEGIVSVNGKLHVLFESAANRFLVGKLFGADYVYSLDI